jgi:beta-phosphoglucomutase
MIQGFVFDLDGVLVDSTRCHREAFEQVLADFGIHDFVYANYAGWRTPEVFADVFSRAAMVVSADSQREASQRKSRLAREKLAACDPVKPRCVEVLGTLAQRYRLALATSGSSESAKWFLDTTGTRALFHSVLTGNDVTRAKPAPEIYERSFDALSLPGDDCVVVEDAVAGVQAGLAAGGMVIGVAGTCGREVLLAAGANRVIQQLDELLEMSL